MGVNSNEPRTLSAEQTERLKAALEKRRALVKPTQRKIIIPQEEYARRLRQDMLADRKLAEESRQANVERNIKDWYDRIEDRWRDASIDNPEMDPRIREKILDRVERWNSSEGRNQLSMLFTGLLGRGKTWSAYAYCFELIRRGILTSGQIFVSTERALAAVASSGFEKEKRLDSLLSPNYKLYMIDDIGRGAFTGTGESARGAIWFEILNHVYTRRLAFVGTTNLGVHEVPDPANPKKKAPSRLEGWLGAASFERLGHMVGGSGYVSFGEATRDMRKEKGQQWEQEYRSARS